MTITSTTLGWLAAFAAVFSLASGGVSLWRRRVPGQSGLASARAAIYLSRYAMALEYYGLRRKEIRSNIEALRADLVAVEPGGVEATLRGLGPPRTLAAEVTSGLLRPSFLRGTIAFALAVIASGVLAVMCTEAFLGGFEAFAEPGEQATWSALGFSAGATMGPDGGASTIEFGGISLALAPLVAFVVGSRLWRLARRP